MKSETTNWLPVIDNSKLKHDTKMNNFILLNTIGHIEPSLHIYLAVSQLTFICGLLSLCRFFCLDLKTETLLQKTDLLITQLKWI